MIPFEFLHRAAPPYAYTHGQGSIKIRVLTHPATKWVRCIYGDRYSKSHEQIELQLVGGYSLKLWQATLFCPTNRCRYKLKTSNMDEYSGPLHNPSLWFEVPYIFQQPPFSVRPEIASVYQIFPDRFAPKFKISRKLRSYLGGTIHGIAENIDYFKSIGVNALYLNPIWVSASYHHYDVIDHYSIDKHLGDMTSWLEFTQLAKNKNLAVILDGVFNHTSDRHPYFQHAKAFSDSPYANYYKQLPNLSFETFAFVKEMPKLNLENEKVLSLIQEVMTYWERSGVTGWRLDVANEMPRHSWNYLRSKFPKAYWIGEIWHDASEWVYDMPYTGTTDYLFRGMVLDLLKNKITQEQFVDRYLLHEMLYTDKQHSANWAIIGSHDTPRITTEVQGNKDLVDLAFAVQWSSNQTPVLYYGDEAYLEGGKDPLCRAPFSPAAGTNNLIKELACIRNTFSWISGCPLEKVYLDQHGLLHIERSVNGNTIGLIVNLCKSSASVDTADAQTVVATRPIRNGLIPPCSAVVKVFSR